MLKKLGIAIALISQLAAAEIYQWTDEKGQTHYSESLPKNLQDAKNIKLRDEQNLPGITTMDAQEFREPIYESYSQRVTQTNNDADWNSCAETKRRAVVAEKRRSPTAEKLNEWLWHNCKSYSNELREIERQMM